MNETERQIVAWLRKFGDILLDAPPWLNNYAGEVLHERADAIERGEHRGSAAIEETTRLRAENERLEEELAVAQDYKDCACSYDNPNDICLGHKKLFERLAALQETGDDEITRLRAEVERLKWQRNLRDEFLVHHKMWDAFTEHASQALRETIYSCQDEPALCDLCHGGPCRNEHRESDDG